MRRDVAVGWGWGLVAALVLGFVTLALCFPEKWVPTVMPEDVYLHKSVSFLRVPVIHGDTAVADANPVIAPIIRIHENASGPRATVIGEDPEGWGSEPYRATQTMIDAATPGMRALTAAHLEALLAAVRRVEVLESFAVLRDASKRTFEAQPDPAIRACMQPTEAVARALAYEHDSPYPGIADILRRLDDSGASVALVRAIPG